MKTLTKITAMLILLISTTSCFVDGFTGIKGNRNVVSEDRTISDNFDEIKVQQGIQLFITQDNTTEIKVEADENIIDLLITESTYSQANQMPRQEAEHGLIEFANEVMDRKGTLFIPSFSVERSQEIACVLKKSIGKNGICSKLFTMSKPTFIDWIHSL